MYIGSQCNRRSFGSNNAYASIPVHFQRGNSNGEKDIKIHFKEKRPKGREQIWRAQGRAQTFRQKIWTSWRRRRAQRLIVRMPLPSP